MTCTAGGCLDTQSMPVAGGHVNPERLADAFPALPVRVSRLHFGMCAYRFLASDTVRLCLDVEPVHWE